MYRIQKITSHPVVDFAAEELKKYLRMMMPRCGEIVIDYSPEATDGFRLGLMQDFSLDVSEAKDPQLDDILYVDTHGEGGIIAGSNMRSVLLAVYKYLSLNGCRWLLPGIDGEYIPICQVQPTHYRKMADNRYRGQCLEGAQSQQTVLAAIDLAPKLGLNTLMSQFDIPRVFYNWYYNHFRNEANREPELLSDDTILQWKRAFEVELSKRGIHYHDIGHGWTAVPFGISIQSGWKPDATVTIPEETRELVAMTGGKRQLFKNVAQNTNICMSNPQARSILVNAVCDFARTNSQVDCLHVWLADGEKNFCECDACREKNPSDWYVVLLNEIDEALTRQNLKTRIVFLVYSETSYEPTCEFLKNPDRFTMLLCPITRSYLYSPPQEPQIALQPFRLNVSGRPDTLEEYVLRLRRWQKFAPCDCIVFDYHFWRHQYYALGVLPFAKRIYEDIPAYKAIGGQGIINCGTQRPFFPNGFSMFTFAQTLFDSSLDLQALQEDYFRHAYGEAWQIATAFLQTLETLIPQAYLETRHTAHRSYTEHYKPEMEESFKKAIALCEKLEQDLQPYRNMPNRVQTVAVRLLGVYAQYCRHLAKLLSLKCTGQDGEAEAAFLRFVDDFGKWELAIEPYYDHALMFQAMRQIFMPIRVQHQ